MAQQAPFEENMSRRGFLRSALALPVALGALAAAPSDALAATASTVTLCKAYVRIKGPKAWKKAITIAPMGHTSGAYHIDCYYRDNYSFLPLRFDGDSSRKARGKTKVSAGKILKNADGAVSWTLKRGKVVVYANAANTPYIIWQSAHHKGMWSDMLTEKESKELLKLTTGGKIKYATLIKWSQKKAKTQGSKAVRSWVGAKVIKKCTVM